jgi:hypothetical protein
MRFSVAPLRLLLLLPTLAPLWSVKAPAHDPAEHAEPPPGATASLLLAQLSPPPAQTAPAAGENPGRLTLLKKPPQTAAFEKFAPRVRLRWDEKQLFVESNGMPAHPMMVGITA